MQEINNHDKYHGKLKNNAKSHNKSILILENNYTLYNIIIDKKYRLCS